MGSGGEARSHLKKKKKKKTGKNVISFPNFREKKTARHFSVTTFMEPKMCFLHQCHCRPPYCSFYPFLWPWKRPLYRPLFSPPPSNNWPHFIHAGHAKWSHDIKNGEIGVALTLSSTNASGTGSGLIFYEHHSCIHSKRGEIFLPPFSPPFSLRGGGRVERSGYVTVGQKTAANQLARTQFTLTSSLLHVRSWESTKQTSNIAPKTGEAEPKKKSMVEDMQLFCQSQIQGLGECFLWP